MKEGAEEPKPIVIEDEARRAIDGDRDALENLVRALAGRHLRPCTCACCAIGKTRRMQPRRFWSE